MSAGKSALCGRMDATAFVPAAEIMFHLSADQKSYFSQHRQQGNALADSFWGAFKAGTTQQNIDAKCVPMEIRPKTKSKDQL